MPEIPAQLRTSTDGAIRWVVIDNMRRLNAFTRDMWAALPGLLSEAEQDPSVRVIVIRGAGEKSFSAGADISEFSSNRTGHAARQYDEINHAAYVALTACSKPTIAMVGGYCFGGACELAICCDLRLCSEDAIFSIPAAKLSLGYNPRWIRPMLSVISPAKAKEMLFTGRRYTAAEAVQMGLANAVCQSAALEAETVKLATEIAANAPLSIRAAKSAVDELAANAQSADLEHLDRMVAACFDSEDYKEGQEAFLAKRTPVFRGR